MDKKQKLRVVVIFPLMAVVLILGGVVYGVLQSASATQSAPSFPSPSEAGAGIEAEVGASASAEAGVVEGYSGEDGHDPVVENAAPAPSCAFDFLIGQTYAQAEEKVKPLNRPYRVLKPGDMVTMEYSEGRINIHVDEIGMVTSVTCG